METTVSESVGGVWQKAFLRTLVDDGYLGRYTHKVPISNQRLQSLQAGKVSFSYKYYR